MAQAGAKQPIANWQHLDRSNNFEHFASKLDAVAKMNGVREYRDHAAELLKVRSGSVLDAGCGLGDVATSLARRVGKGFVLAVDKSNRLVDLARKRQHARPSPKLRFLCEDIRDLSADDNFFDAVHVERTLVHIHRHKRALRELVRVLKPGGRIVAAEPSWSSLLISPPLKSIQTTFRLSAWLGSRFVNPNVGIELPGLLKELGCSQICTHPHVIWTNSFPIADAAVGMKWMANNGAAAGIVSQVEARRWLLAQEQAFQRGEFLCSLNIILVCARKIAR